LGKTGINLSYQAGAQNINAETDRQDLLEPVRENNRASLPLSRHRCPSRGFFAVAGERFTCHCDRRIEIYTGTGGSHLQLFAGVTGTSGFIVMAITKQP